MKPNWMTDARQIPDEVMTDLHHVAIRTVNDMDYSPADVADNLGISRSSIYDWLNRFAL